MSLRTHTPSRSLDNYSAHSLPRSIARGLAAATVPVLQSASPPRGSPPYRSHSIDITPTPEASTSSQQAPQERALHELTNDDIIIAVVGPTGVGKSNFINVATGGEIAAVGHSLSSGTREVQAVAYKHPDGKRNVVFLDTPGTDDDQYTDLDILEKIAVWLQTTYQRKVHLSGLLWLHRISDRRMGETALKNIRMFEELCGKDALGNVVLVTTMWDDVSAEVGQDREKQLRTQYWKTMVSAGARVMRFTDTYDSAWAIVNKLKPRRVVTQLQDELVNQKRPLIITSASQALLGWFDRVFGNVLQKARSLRRGKVNKRRKSESMAPPMVVVLNQSTPIIAPAEVANSLRRRSTIGSIDTTTTSVQTTAPDEESKKEGEMIRGCLRAAREYLRVSRSRDGATQLQDFEGDDNDNFYSTLGFALGAAEKLLTLALDSPQPMEREYLGVVWKIGYFLVAVAELTRSYGLRNWNVELAKIIHLLAKIQNDFVSARKAQPIWQPRTLTSDRARRLADWQKTVEQSCGLFDVQSPITIQQAIAHAYARLDQAQTPT